LYRDDFLQSLPNHDPLGFLRAAHARMAARDELTAISLTDLVTYLPCDLMTKVDMASMAHGLECRQPMLDHRLVELVATMPRAYKFAWGRGKRILRRTFGALLPRSIWVRRKMGFAVPLDHWFRRELRDMTRETLLSDSARCLEFFRPQAIRELVEQHQRGQADHSHKLWALLVFENWLRQWGSAAQTFTVG
jgi:asparagine synthase (glutamine-hydrolysing)